MLNLLSSQLHKSASVDAARQQENGNRLNRALTGILAPGPKLAIAKPRRLPWNQAIAGLGGSSSSSNTAKPMPYFKPPAHCATGKAAPKPKAIVMSGKRKVACDIASNIGKLGNALSSLDNMLINSRSNAVANSRIKSYEAIMSKTAIKPWPATEVSLYTFIGIAVAAEYAPTPEIVSDVLAASPKLEDYIGLRTREVIARLRRKGVFGDRNQKQALTLRMIGRLKYSQDAPSSSIIARVASTLLIAFYGAMRKSEAASVVYGKPSPDYIGIKYDNSDESLVLDFSMFRQKGGPRCSKVTRIFCACAKDRPQADGRTDQLCLIHSSPLRTYVESLHHGGLDVLWALNTLLKALKLSPEEAAKFATHSCRVGCAVHLFSLEIAPEQIIHHARWSDTTMLFYYARNSKKHSRPPHWSNNINWIKNSAVLHSTLVGLTDDNDLDLEFDFDNLILDEDDE
ncbi:unnamed protein product [Amoebophrya sp. A25]|nr:unnamed protein product [Amoebophrya sp. A25]|eukprot:GSA25T00000318001.1